MKTILLVLVAFVLSGCCSALFAQTEQITQLERDLTNSSGLERVKILLAVSDACAEAGQHQKAADYASQGAELARELGAYGLQAHALNKEGKALAIQKKRGFLGKDLAAPKFTKSIEIVRRHRLGDKALLVDNLLQLRAIAVRKERTEEVASIDEQLTRLQKENADIPSSPTAPASSSANPATQQPQTPPTPSATGITVTAAETRMLTGNRDLEAMLAEKQALIDAMNEEQVKTELVLMQQRSMLDSMAFHRSLDSLSVANWNLALREAESSRNFNYAVMGLLLVLAGGAGFSYFRARQNAVILREKNKIIREEQERSENLLLNILPSLIAGELKAQGRTDARFHEDVCVLFADFVGFSKIAEKVTPQQLVNDLDACFKAFDEIMARYGLEKIKTIGDAYMCAGGLDKPATTAEALRNMIAAAKEMQLWLHRWNADREALHLPRYDARIGIHRGPVVSGVVGSKKFAFDIWGDTVNIASRVEHAGESGKINISGEVYNTVREYYPCQYRGKIAVKNKGEIDMYFVEN